jgi:hypothetical protein
MLENWFYAIWAYNSGFHKPGEAGSDGAWGLGWLNNPANPRYPADRGPFLKSPADAAHPGQWPYPEKVIGFAANSIAKASGPGFKPAWWLNETLRDQAKPPLTQFCSIVNDCVPGALIDPNAPDVDDEKPGPCAHHNAAGQYDLKCWVHTSNEWRFDCDLNCGHGWDRFDPGMYPEQPDGTNSPPDCHVPVSLAGAWIIDDTPNTFTTPRPGCTKNNSSGTFQMTFGQLGGTYLSKIDVHQMDAGFGGHFWYGHTRTLTEDRAGGLRITGKWTLNQAYSGWARVLVHMPDISAHTQQAAYDVDLGNGRHKKRTLLQRTEENKWVSLGVFQFGGTPSITLTNNTKDGGTDEAIAWDAVAIDPMVAKPHNFIVSMGDSFASGEGTGGILGERFFRESDNNGGNGHRDACHRSKDAWARVANVPSLNTTIGYLDDNLVDHTDFHFVACSGARAHNLLPSPLPGQTNPPKDAWGNVGGPSFRELSQIDSGYLDENTTLVTLSIGGNDAEFTKVMSLCFKPGSASCAGDTLDGDTEPLGVAEPKRISQQVAASVKTVLTEIARAAPNAKILLMGYPKLFEPNASCLGVITADEANWLNQMSDVMETAMTSAVAAANAGTSNPEDYKVIYMPVGAMFDGNRFCGPETLAFNGIILDKTDGDTPSQPISAQSFHPTRDGAQLLSFIYATELGRIGVSG